MIANGGGRRVMFVTPCFGYGGLERVLLDIIGNLDRTRFTPAFCTLLEPDSRMYARLERLDLPCTVLDKGEGINWSIPFRLSRLLRREHIELVNAHDIGATLYAAPAARLAGIGKFVHTDHSQILTKTSFQPVYRWILRNLVTRSITVSLDLEEHLVREYGIPRAAVETIPNGIDVGRFADAADPAGLRRELRIPGGVPVVGTIGRLTKQKGTEYLIRAFDELSNRSPDAILVIVGDGELRPDLEALAAGLASSGSIVFTGIREDVPELLRLFDIFVLPSLWEGQPVTIMEAMAAGLPIVATDVGGNAEILHGGEYGLLVPPADPGELAAAMIELLGDVGRARRLGEHARIRAASELGATTMTRRYEAVFESLFD